MAHTGRGGRRPAFCSSPQARLSSLASQVRMLYGPLRATTANPLRSGGITKSERIQPSV
ncbi:MAG: hypothetical protein V4717_24560 [Bacteroidota bacterium]